MLWLLGLLGPQGIAIAVGVSLLGSASAGAYGMHRWDKATEYKQQVQALQHRLDNERKERANEQAARAADAIKADADSQDMQRLQGVINDITSKIGSPSAQCFTLDESNQLRRLWKSR